MLYPADVIRMAEEAKAIGVHARIEKVDFDLIMKRVWEIVLDGRHEMERGVAHSEQIAFYNTYGSFVSDYAMQVDDEQITADTIVIASGARPFIPPIEGVEEVGYLTSATIFDIKESPESLIIVGGGYIAAEFAHFFSAIGTQVTVLGRNPHLVPHEEPEISELLKAKMSRYCQVRTDHEVVRARRWTATVVGFLGVLVILRPGFQELHLEMLLPVLAALFMALSVLVVKSLARTDSPGAIVLYMNVLLTPLSLIPALFVWRWPSAEVWAMMVGIGLLAALSHLLMTRAYKIADASAVLPFDYTRLPFIALLAFLFYGEVPDGSTWVGAAIIAASTFYIARREAVVSRERREALRAAGKAPEAGHP
jgi:uncharacterized membrane protein